MIFLMIFQFKNSSFQFFKKRRGIRNKIFVFNFFSPRKWRQKFAKRSPWFSNFVTTFDHVSHRSARLVSGSFLKPAGSFRFVKWPELAIP